MGLKSEIDEIINDWSQTSPLRKVYQAFSFYLTISAIASLLSGIFNWKGIFKDALTFYHQFVRGPLHQVFFYFKLDFRPEYLDFIVIYFLLLSAFISLRFVEIQNSVKINWRLASNLLGGILVIAIPVALGTDRFITWHIVGIQIFYILLLPIQLGLEQKKAFYLPLLCAVSAVGIMWAINWVIWLTGK